MPNFLPENWKNGAASQTEKHSGRTALARRLSVWLGLSVAAMGGIWKVAQTTNRYAAQGAHPAPQTSDAAGTWNTTTAQFWLPATPTGPLWNSGGADGDAGSPSAPGEPIAIGTNLLEWDLVFTRARAAFSGSAVPSLGVDPLANGGGVDWSTIGTIEGGEAGSGDAGDSPERPFAGRGHRGIFADFDTLPGLFDLAAVNEESGLDVGMFAPYSGFDSFTLAGNLVPITRSFTSDPAPAPASGGSQNPTNSFFAGSTLNLNAGPAPTVATNASGPHFSASAADILPPTIPEFTGPPPAPPVRFRMSRVKVYDIDGGAMGSAGPTTEAEGTIASSLTTSANSGPFPSSPFHSSSGSTTAFTGGPTGNFGVGGLSMFDGSASGATLSTVGGSTSTNTDVVSTTSVSNALVTSSAASSAAPIVLTAAVVSPPTSPSGTALTSDGSSPTTQVLLASLGTPNKIVSVPSAGTVNTFASSPSSNLNNPAGLAFSLTGNLYVANNGNNTIEGSRLAPNGQIGSDAGTFATASAGLNSPVGLAVDSAGNLYVANNAASGTDANSILKITPTGSSSVFVGASVGTPDLNSPTGMAFDGSGNLYVTNNGANTISKITPGGTVTTFITAAANLNGPTGLAFDGLGNLYVAYAVSGVIEEYSSSGADLGAYVTEALFSFPAGVAFDNSGDLFVANPSLGNIDEYTSKNATAIAWATGVSEPEYLAFANVPEPGAAWLLLSGAAGLGCLRRRRGA